MVEFLYSFYLLINIVRLNTGPECFSCRKTNKEEQSVMRITVQKTTNTVQPAAIVPYISF